MYRYNMAVVFAFALLGVVAAQSDCRPNDCYDLKCYRVSKGNDGPHTIYPSMPQLTSLQVSCDQATDGGGWIMLQHRIDVTVNFTRNWKEYKYGFGDHGDNTTELWLGNEKVYQVLQSIGSTEWQLRIEVDAFDGSGCWVVASNFRMNNEALRYSMDWDNVSASVIELVFDWNYHKLIPFNTLDNNEGHDDMKACVDRFKGGWWYDDCFAIFLNGRYGKRAMASSMSISFLSFKYHGIFKRSRMMFRPQNEVIPCNNPCKNGGACEYNAATNSGNCRCTAEFSGSMCESIYNDTHSGIYNDTDSDIINDTDSDMYNDTTDSGIYNDTDSDIYNDTNSDNDTDSYIYNATDRYIYNDTDNDADSDTDSTLSAIIAGILLVLILIAGAILYTVIRHRNKRKAVELAAGAKEEEEYDEIEEEEEGFIFILKKCRTTV